MATINYNLQMVADTAATLYDLDPVLENGQVGLEVDTNLFKIGNGTLRWREMNYVVTNNNQSTWVGVSRVPDNQLSNSEVDGGIYLGPNFDGDIEAAYANGRTAGKTTTVIEPSLLDGLDSQQKQVAAKVGWIIERLVFALGPSFAALSNNQHPVVESTPLTINKVIQDIVNTTIANLPSNQFGAQIVDNQTATTSVWSSTKTSNEISTAISAAITDLVGSAPEELNTLYEIAAAIAANGDILGGIVSELATVVRYSEQTRTEPEKEQARANIGAADAAFVGRFGVGQDITASNYLVDVFEQSKNTPFTTTPYTLPPFC